MSKASSARRARRSTTLGSVSIPSPAIAFAAAGPSASPSPSSLAPRRGALVSWMTREWSSATLTGLGIAAVALALFSFALLQPRFLDDVMPTHMAIGDWIIAHRAAPRTEVFSWWAEGQPFQASEWLSEVVMAIAFHAFGFGGLILLGAIALACTVLIVGLAAGRKLGGLPLLVTLALSGAVLTDTTARPYLFVLPLTVAWTSGLIIAREQKRAPSLWLAIIMILWVNMHGSFILGFFLLAPLALEAVVESRGQRRAVACRWGVFAGVSLVAALINPYGVAAFEWPFRLMAMKNLQIIMEWMPPLLAGCLFLDAFLFALVGCALVLPLRLPPIRAAMILALIFETLMHLRHANMLASLSPMLIAGPLAKALEQKRVVDWRRATRIATFFTVFGCFLGAGLLAWLSFGKGYSPGPVYDEMTSALDAVPLALRSHRVENDMGVGGFLIGAGVHPKMDDRIELYDRSLVFNYKFLDENRIDWTFVEIEASLWLEQALNADPAWVSLYRGPHISVHARKSALLDAIKDGGS
jgi:hypothetical protein